MGTSHCGIFDAVAYGGLKGFQMAFETILLDRAQNGVATLTLNRPERMNAFTVQMAREIRSVWDSLRGDSSVRAIVIRAAEGRAFCTGVDVAELWPQPLDRPFDFEDPGEYLGPKSNQLWKPVITAVHGLAAGGAFYFLNESDIVICSDDAQFFDPHVTFGMVAAVEPIGALHAVPYQEVMRMALMGNDERISAQTALRISLVTEVTTRDRLWPRAQEIAASIASKPANAIQGTVKALWEAIDVPRSAAVARGAGYTQIGNRIEDGKVARAQPPKVKWVAR
jgi:enoyl-CoA hydratase/carnithine racemase